MKFSEDTRVKIPAILHLVRLGYDYISLKDHQWDASCNIFPDLFRESLVRINPHIIPSDADRLLADLVLTLDNEDLGRAFHEKLTDQSGIRLIDFENFDNNCFHVVTELPCIKDDEEFRPDITLLINGMPLVFIEVKKPNNREGILAERARMVRRLENPKFRRFINITQLMMFSNNMKYDDSTPEPIEGAFYAAPAYGTPHFNYFREELEDDFPSLITIDESVEDFVLSDNNLHAIKTAPDFATNKSPTTPTNHLCTSLFSRERLAFLLKYSIAYVRNEEGAIEKHIMRYPQLFASLAIQQALEEGVRKGIIWHTQGSGKTALAYYSVSCLTDYYRAKNIVPKFYFIVDRLDLAIQATKEFRSRGLIVHEVDSRNSFKRDISSNSAIHNSQGKLEITVVNIQKFQDQSNVVKNTDYNIGLQRIYFLDEVHRSYNPAGSFLANLSESDPNAIKIGLTGTPLIGDNLRSRDLFGDYIHKYYYNASIKDGYTLRLIREDIETSYKMQLAKALEDIEVLKKSANREIIYADPAFVEPMLDYIVADFERSRLVHDDPSIGAMVICDSSAQAKMMHDIFEEKYVPQQAPIPVDDYGLKAAEATEYSFRKKKSASRKVTTATLILHDIGTKESRKEEIEAFKEGKTDILFVFNMLLTGFDAPRLKKLYLGRVIKAHNLLQALTRVNRTYRDFQLGYVVDFADISKEFDKTNKAYFDELQSELGDEIEEFSNLFKSAEEIDKEISAIKEVLFKFDTENLENFSSQISEIEDRAEMLKIVKCLNDAKSLYNLIRLSGQYEQLDKLDFKVLPKLATMATDHLAIINQKLALESGDENANLLKVALEDIVFTFTKRGEHELKIADEFRDTIRKTRELLGGNFDPGDPIFISLKAELERIFKKKKFSEITQTDMEENIVALNAIQKKARELERNNKLLRAKYANDAKYARLHKRLREKFPLSDRESKLLEALCAFKAKADEQILHNSRMLENSSYSEREMLRLTIAEFGTGRGFSFSADDMKDITRLILKEYQDESQGNSPA